MPNESRDSRFAKWGSLVLLMLALGLAGCSGGGGGGGTPNPGDPVVPPKTLSGAVYKAIEGSVLTEGAQGISGTGGIVFNEPRSGEDSNFALKFSLEKNGSVTLVANSDASLNQGVNLVFERKSDDSLGVKLISSSDNYDLSEDFAGVSAAGPLDLSVDVHGHGHMIVFLGSSEFEYMFDARPKSRFWGLKLATASVTDAKADKAKKVE